jgi:acetyl-CoA carboxylase biotin carboxyl carrier protein
MKAKAPIDPEIIRSLAEILKETDLTEIEVEQEGLKLRVARNIQYAAQVAVPMHAPQPMAMPASVPVPAAAPTPASGPNPNAVTSPMVGTVYLRPAPDKPNFIEVGQQVKQGQTILIIEAMKTFNEIPSPRAGTVKGFLVENGQPVEFGAALAIVE